MAFCAMSALILAFAGCKTPRPEAADPIAHFDSYDIWPDSIDLHNDVILRVMNDSIMEVRVNGNPLDTIHCGKVRDRRMTFTSDYPLLDFLYRLEASLPANTGFTTATPYEIFLNPLQTDSAQEILQSRLVNGVVLPYQDGHLEWPAVNVNSEWLLGATELLCANGDEKWRKTVVKSAELLISTDRKLSFNPATGLYTGVPRYMAVARGIFPDWMTPEDIGAQATLAVNMEYCAVMNRLKLPHDSLRRTIDNLLWIPNMGYFSALAYGFPTCQMPLQATDNLAQAIGIISGQLTPAMAETVVRKTPVYQGGVTLFQPMLPPASGEVSLEIPATLLQTAWTIAVSRVENRAAYASAMGALFVCEGERLMGARDRMPRFRSTFTAFILRALAGMEFHDEGIFFVPNVPENIPGDKKIRGLKYRDAILDIDISGTGRAIATFTIDDAPAEPFFNGSMKGHHSISITLAGPAADPGNVNLLENLQVAPLPPVAQWNGSTATLSAGSLPDRLKDNALNTATREMLAEGSNPARLVYLNGVLQEEIYRDTYELYHSRHPVVAQFTAFYNSQLSGFSSAPHLSSPRRGSTLLSASELAKPGTKVLEDKELASKFVESNRFKNRFISFEYDAPSAGRYLVDVRYINGLGIVNSRRKLALRQLWVNSRQAGIFFFPQLRAHADTDSWQEQTNWTNPLIVNLEKGKNSLQLRVYQPSPVYADPNSNMILFDLIRITPTP